METYKIVRFDFAKGNRTMETGLSLEEAQAHCQEEHTSLKDKNGNVIWFDGYTKE